MDLHGSIKGLGFNNCPQITVGFEWFPIKNVLFFYKTTKRI